MYMEAPFGVHICRIPGRAGPVPFFPPGIPDRHGTVVQLHRPAEHFLLLQKAGGCQNFHTGHLPQKAHIKNAMVGGAVVTNQSCPVNGQDHMEMQQRHILHQLVIGTLQKRGIQRHHRDHALFGQAACHRDGVLLRDPHIKGPLREPLQKCRQACAGGHGRCNGTHTRIPLGKLCHGLTKGVGECDSLSSQALAGDGIEFPDAMEPGGVLLSRRIAAALFGDDVDQHRLPHLLGRAKQRHNTGQIVSVRRAQVGQAHIFKYCFR